MTSVPCYTREDFHGMRQAGQLAASTLRYIEPYVQENITTLELNDLCEKYIRDHQGIPAPLEQGFPKAVCISVNQEVCHGIPGAKKIKKGDLVKIDVSVNLHGWYGDTCRSFLLEPVYPRVALLTKVTKEALDRAIECVKPGARLGDIGAAIAMHVRSFGFSVVRDFCGHGIGKTLHQAPEVLHYGKAGSGMLLQEGHCFTIEPMINSGTYEIKILKDGWTAVTRDHHYSAQFEHTLGVTETGCEIFTL